MKSNGIAFLVLLKTLAPSEMGSRIVALRRKGRLSLAQQAEALGIPQRTLSFYERGGRHSCEAGAANGAGVGCFGG